MATSTHLCRSLYEFDFILLYIHNINIHIYICIYIYIHSILYYPLDSLCIPGRSDGKKVYTAMRQFVVKGLTFH